MMVILNVINEPKVRFYSDACNVRKFFYTLRGLKLCISTSPVPVFADNFEKIEPRTPCSFLPRTFCNLKEVRPRTFGNLKEVGPRTFCNLEEVELCLTAGGSRREHLRIISSPPSPIDLEGVEPRTPCSFLPRTFCNLKEVRPRTFGNLKELRPCTLCNLEEVELCLTAGGSRREHLRILVSPISHRPRRGRTTHTLLFLASYTLQPQRG
ncbi:hypothetical protein Bacsa_2670 [Phocaeicola salanitronis DSM 18170]|uniref:Uncharacterized protein n=1 Tax=Phocaeicola salanitronis (strain DSM 18170 / JCM 13657 / CCUG 60908 / BL78) TaxID=667015 RepID=F0QZT3_PHOSB|nr:hypothetical protein Bacsa_2670 [Phocaeicola salanitronis DSM 18170]